MTQAVAEVEAVNIYVPDAPVDPDVPVDPDDHEDPEEPDKPVDKGSPRIAKCGDESCGCRV